MHLRKLEKVSKMIQSLGNTQDMIQRFFFRVRILHVLYDQLYCGQCQGWGLQHSLSCSPQWDMGERDRTRTEALKHNF